MALSIRPFELADSAACEALFLSNTPDYFLPGEIGDFRHYLRDYALGSYWVALRDGAIVAAGGIRKYENGDGGLCYGMVDRALHRCGVGSQLMRFRLAELSRDPAVKAVRLDTSQRTPGFFQRFGFHVVETEKDGYGPGLDRNEMRAELPADRAAWIAELLRA